MGRLLLSYVTRKAAASLGAVALSFALLGTGGTLFAAGAAGLHALKEVVGHDDVQFAVAVDVGDRERERPLPRGEFGVMPERPVPVSEQDRDRRRVVVRREQVELRVAVDSGPQVPDRSQEALLSLFGMPKRWLKEHTPSHRFGFFPLIPDEPS